MPEYMLNLPQRIKLIIASAVLSHKSTVVSLVLPENLTYSAKTFVSLYGMYYILVYL